MPESYSEGVYFTLGKAELLSYVKHLREEERVDLIVVVSHLGYPQELKLAQEVDGIDILLSGHTHNRLRESMVENGAIVMQSGCHGSFIGRLDLEVGDRGVKRHTHRLIDVDESFAPNPEVEDMVAKATEPP